MTQARILRQRQARRRRTKPSARRSRRQPPKLNVDERPHVLVLGQSELSKRLARTLAKFGVPSKHVDDPEQANGAVNERTMGLIVVPPIPSLSVLAYARRKASRSPAVPTFVVMSGPMPPRTSRALYAEGITAVFEWPSEADAIKRTMLRLTSSGPLTWGRKRTAAEVALEETTRAHLRADATPFGAELIVEACGRVILLKGSVDALWKLELARQVASDVSGVDDVIADGVEVAGTHQEDRKVAQAIRAVLKAAAAVEGSTLAVAVRSGEVTLAGSVEDRQEARRAIQLVQQVRGVRRIDDYLVVSKTAKHRDSSLARRVRTALKSRYPRMPVELSVFGNVAVMSGRVPSARHRDQIRELVEHQSGVDRVVDKLQVHSRNR